jgi:hypothetical protein
MIENFPKATRIGEFETVADADAYIRDNYVNVYRIEDDNYWVTWRVGFAERYTLFIETAPKSQSKTPLASVNAFGHLSRRTLSPADIAHTHAMGEQLPAWDSHGYEIAYYVATAAGTEVEDDDSITYMMLDGEIAIRDHTGDVLCADCANANDTLGGDEILYVAYQGMGEIANAEPVYCDNCNECIYNPTS